MIDQLGSCPNDGIIKAHIGQVAVSFEDKTAEARGIRSGDRSSQTFPKQGVLYMGKNSIHLTLRPEIDGFQARYLQLTFCLYFLKQDTGRPQERHSKSATCLYFKTEITTGM